MRRRAAASAVAVLALATLVTGFGGGQGRAGASAGKGGGGFPVSVSSGGGTVRIASRPLRILSLSASATQMLYAVGAGRQVVGVDKYSTYPKGAPKTQFSGFETDAEDYLPLHPDLVVLAFDPGHLVAQLKDLHIPTLVMPAPSTLAGAYGQIRELALATGHRAGGARSVASVQGLLARTAAAAGSKAHGRSYYIELDPTLYTATSSTFIGALLSRLRMRDVADGAGHGTSYPRLSAEFLVKANPDYVFLADSVCCQQSAATFAGRPGFGGLRAVRLHHVVAVNDSLASEWGPHSMEGFLQVVSRAVTGQRVG